MLSKKHEVYTSKFTLTVVKKMIIGFASLALLLVVTSGLSYIGLRDIKASAEEIEKMIGELQQDSQRAVQAMNQGSQQVKMSVELSGEVSSQVNEIRLIIEGLAFLNNKVVKETMSQDMLLDDVVTRLVTIVTLSQQSEVSVRASNDATHEIEEQMNALREAVGKFKLM